MAAVADTVVAIILQFVNVAYQHVSDLKLTWGVCVCVYQLQINKAGKYKYNMGPWNRKRTLDKN